LKKNVHIIIQISLALLAFVGSAYVALTPANSMMNWYNIDDAFYYYKVAQNILTGNGISFDGINLANGFHPLWMIVCLGVFWLAKFNLLLPLRVLILVSGFFNAATCVLLFRFLQRHIHWGAAILGAAAWALYPPIYDNVITHGMEAAVSAFFIVLLVSMATKIHTRPEETKIKFSDFLWLGIVGAMTILSRLDNLFLVALVGLFTLLKIKKIPPRVIFDLIAISISVFAAWIIRLGSEGVVQHTYTIYPMLIVSVLVKPVVLFFAGCYTEVIGQKRWRMILKLSLAAMIALVIEYGILALLFKIGVTKMFSNSIMLFDALISLGLILLVHIAFSRPTGQGGIPPVRVFTGWLKTNWKGILKGGIGYSIPIAFLVGAYMVFNKLTFGTFSPISGQIKLWWGTMINTVYSHPVTLISVLGLSTADNYGPWSLVTSKLMGWARVGAGWVGLPNPEILFGLLVLITLALFFWRMGAEKGRLARKFFHLLLPALLIGSIIHITYYTATGYTHTRGWYWVGEMLTLVVTGSLVVDGVFTWIDKPRRKKNLSPYFFAIVFLLLLQYHFTYIRNLARWEVAAGHEADYLAEIRDVEFHTLPKTKIGMTGGGMVAYFIQDRTVVNLDGLINSPEYFNAMKSGKATMFLDAIPLNYVYGKPYVLLESDPYDEIFANRLEEIGFIRGYENFTLFRYRINQ
jgi:hypothetical protein